jgi:hypothetical protein
MVEMNLRLPTQNCVHGSGNCLKTQAGQYFWLAVERASRGRDGRHGR